MKRLLQYLAMFALLLIATDRVALAQFSSSVQGTITDPSGAVIPHAQIKLTSDSTKVTQTVESAGDGVYRFPSIAPGAYTIEVTSQGFALTRTRFALSAAENRDVSVGLTLASSTNVEVTTQQALLDPSDSRLQYTIDTKALNDLPLASRNPTALIGITPGVTGALDAQTNQNSNPENFVDASAGGHGENGNLYVVDGLDVTSNIRPGVINLTPSSDSVQEVSVQTNTFNVEYGRGSGIETLLTTKSGSDQFHGFASDYFQSQRLRARGEFGSTHADLPSLAPFHSNSASFGVGGPIWRAKKLFFFAAYQPYSYEGSSYGQVLFEDPAFTTFAQAAKPNSPELQLLTKYPVGNTTGTHVTQTAAQAFGASNPTANTGCNTASTDFIPCSLAVFDQGNFNYNNTNKSKQYSLRIDKYFNKDRVYADGIRNTVSTSTANPRPAFRSTNQYYGAALQVNETHTFNDHLLNEAIFAVNRIEGIQPQTGLFTVPVVNVGGLGQGFGDGFAQGDYIQHSYHWRDVITFVHGAHDFRFGYEGGHGDDDKEFQGPYGQPTFYYTNLINLINDNPYNETGLSYNFLTGAPQPGNNDFALLTTGIFAQDIWKVNKRVTVTYGIRYDNYGNPHPVGSETVATGFHLGTGSTLAQQIANGALKQQSNLLGSSINWNFAPRVGATWDPTGSGKWVVQGGFGVYRDQITVGNMADITNGNPPNYVLPTFYNDGSTAKPIFSFGTTNSFPFGFQYPAYHGTQLDAKGGQVGAQIGIGATAQDVHSPTSLNFVAGVQRELGSRLVASASYVGSHTSGILLGGLNQGANQFGYDVNAFPGDKISHTSCALVVQSNGTTQDVCNAFLTRLNTSFGGITYQYNTARSNYSALVTSLRGRFATNAFFTASYTRSLAKDDATYYYPTASFDQNRFYGNSSYDVPNRFSLGGSYVTKGLRDGSGFVGRLTGGFTLGGSVTLQSGTPLQIFTNAAYSVSRINPALPASFTNLQYAQNSGDWQGTGYNYAFPNVADSAKMLTTRAAYRSTTQTNPGVFPGCQSFNPTCTAFTQPAFGQEGSETVSGRFRNPAFAQTDMSLQKSTKLYERFTLNIRADLFNAFNQVNFNPLDANLLDGTFGTSSSTHTPRYTQLGATVNF